MKKPCFATLLGTLLLGFHGFAPRPAVAASDPKAAQKTAREMEHIVMQQHDGREKAFVVNTLCTVEDFPPYANILVDSQSNFLACQGGPFALCYYSGPEGTLPCRVRQPAEGKIADCQCIEVPYGPYFVDINAIMDLQTYEMTVAACGKDGSHCPNTNQAPVCDIINHRKLIPGADMISVFSLNCVPEQGIAQIPCDQGIYAGCMTAPCYRNPDDPRGVVRCECPMYDGCFEIGTPGQEGNCFLGRNNVWSSAHNLKVGCPPSQAPACEDSTHPRPPGGISCFPDAPLGTTDSCGDPISCPLYPEAKQPPEPIPPIELERLRESDLCTAVCEEYRQCGLTDADGVPEQWAYTCDSVLCTSRCAADGSFQDDVELTAQACSGLSGCASSPGIGAILTLELELGCSCCASQVCGCGEEAISPLTQETIYDLNQAQCERGIRPQCCRNGTLCGLKNGESFLSSCDSCPSS